MTCCEANNIDCNQGRTCPERQTRVDPPKQKTCSELGGCGPDGCDACAGQGFCNGEGGDIDPDAPDGPLFTRAAACYYGVFAIFALAGAWFMCGLPGYVPEGLLP